MIARSSPPDWRELSPRPPAASLPDQLRALAQQVARLRPPGHRDPEAFWEAKSQLAHELRELAARWESAR